jgi:hypothetical protein
MFTDKPGYVELATFVQIGLEVVVSEFGPLELDPFNPFAPPRNSGKRTRGKLTSVSQTEVSVGSVKFRPDHVSYTSVLVNTDRTETVVLHLHRGHRDDYAYGA